MKYIIIILLIAGFFLYSYKENFKPRKNALSLQQDITPLAPHVAEEKVEQKPKPESSKISSETQFKLDILERNERVAVSRLEGILKNPPVFQERKSTRGLRTSDADRKREIEKRNKEISDLRIYLESIKTERNKLLNK